MILRKPFAILIKHFKLIHFIMFGLMVYITYNTNLILTFLNEYMASTLTLITHESYLNLFKTSFFISIALIFIINSIILGLMAFKKKPIKIYIYNFIAFLYVFIVFLVAKNIIGSLEISLIEIRTLKLVQDLLFAAVLIESVSLIFTVVRATGFDIKSFNFVKDLEELDITEKDDEEFEVNLDVDTDVLKRKINRGFRYFKYIYAENKYVFSILILILVALICGLIYLNMTVYNKVYKEKAIFKTSEFMISIEDSYVTKSDYRENIINKDYSFVVARIKVRTIYDVKKVLETGKIALNINDHNLYPITDYMTEFKDLGNYYNKQYIENKFSNYILIYKIPNSYVNDKMTIKYYDSFLNNIKTRLSPINLNDKKDELVYNVGESIEFENSILNNSNIKINSYEISNNFKSEYNFCLNGTCNVSYEYIKPILNTNYEKTLLKLTGNFNLDETLNITKIANMYEFIKEFGSVSYVIDGTRKIISSELIEVLPIKSTNREITYLELPKEIENSSEIYLHFNVRNREYVYKLR